MSNIDKNMQSKMGSSVIDTKRVEIGNAEDFYVRNILNLGWRGCDKSVLVQFSHANSRENITTKNELFINTSYGSSNIKLNKEEVKSIIDYLNNAYEEME